MMQKSIEIGIPSLTLEDVREIAANKATPKLSEASRILLRKGRTVIDRLVASGDTPRYGINTGFGNLKNVSIPKDQLSQLQKNIIRSHSVGVGSPLPVETVRAMICLRAHTLALGYSGVREEVIDLLLGMLTGGVTPVVPAQGSVGASGDLAPLAHIALAMIGEGMADYKGNQVASAHALREAGLKPLDPGPKEGLALVNGTQMMTALGALTLLRSENVMRHLDIAAAMSLEAMLGTSTAFDERIHRIRPHPGQEESAANLRKLCAGSAIADSHKECGRVQDAYSLRCAPQVHGAARDSLRYVRRVLETEIHSATDNPILFVETGETISAGNFHGQPVAGALDFLALALTSAGSMSERRVMRLLDPKLSDLPPGLIDGAGLRSGLMMVQVTSASLVSECKGLSHPASVDSIPTWAEQEDHVSMGAWAARKSEEVVAAMENIVAIELLCAAQGLEFRKPLSPAPGVAAAHRAIRIVVPELKEDRELSSNILALRRLVFDGGIVDAVEREIGKLH